MTKTKRVFTVLGALLAIQGALFLMIIPEYALVLIAAGLGFSLTCVPDL